MKFLIAGLLALALVAPASAHPGTGGVVANTRPQVEVHGGKARVSGTVPSRVKRMVRAANRIAHRPYVWGGGHGGWRDDGYDCSGSVSYVLHKADLLRQPRVSGDLERFGRPGRGRWVTIYANDGHVWMTIDGVRYDTSALSINGSRWTGQSRTSDGFVARHPVGL